MKKALAGLAVTGLLTLGAGPIVAASAADQQAPVRPQQADTTNTDEGEGGKWGLLGLIGLAGLAGLAGLKRRDRYDDARYATGTRTNAGTRNP